MARRKDWTPPTEKAAIILDSDASSARENLGANNEDDFAKSFGSMVSAYMCGNAATRGTALCQSDGSSAEKTKTAVSKAESAVDLTTTTIANSAARPKTVRKKPRTITSLATAAYRKSTQGETADRVQDTRPFANPRPLVETSKKTKSRKKQSKATKQQEPLKPILFSPETALRQVAKQDFVFGTSSQLATEQSPTFLRDLQLTMKNSNQLDYADFITPLNSDAIEPPEGRPKLWDAAARDADGDLFDVEVVNLTGTSPQLLKTPGIVDPFGYFKGDDMPIPTCNPGSAKSSDNGNELVVDILDVHVSESQATYTTADVSNVLSAMEPKVPPMGKRSVQSEAPSSPDIAGKEHPLPRVTSCALRPTFEDYTDTELSKEISRYGFKPVKRRSAMIALLHQCREQSGYGGQEARMLFTAAANSPTKRPRGRPRKGSVDDGQTQELLPAVQAPETPKGPRGRSGKDSRPTPDKQVVSKRTATKPTKKRTAGSNATPKKAKAVKVIEIPDSESDLADTLDSSRHSSPSSTFSSPQRVDLAMLVDNDSELSLAMTPTDAQACLFAHITKAVTTAPRTTDPANPSWYEKILLYDPIVLEDLASWLNSGQLSRVGYDEEVNPVDLKSWCELRSICCLWKVNSRGKERKRY
ncbi:Structure-specific endonuclease, subunit SLX4 [Metarhizium album ARSEF 1941]|uniref:Structure-specific endonuclease subunit SLX4 n=1 Tax=Metarhizium album (strain ARSEF 1941) TaxID=1081103 RepID=A0A0B2WME5_METAS|nr:Structure-specific endonuclease, subunit SLX4 [Metarhizium album ARSEF 1941]KHN94662.1 Structure-specific endonuclease, subunit SLX4 [Metarhizium album ARSEF 1941]